MGLNLHQPKPIDVDGAIFSWLVANAPDYVVDYVRIACQDSQSSSNALVQIGAMVSNTIHEIDKVGGFCQETPTQILGVLLKEITEEIKARNENHTRQRVKLGKVIRKALDTEGN